MNKIYTHPGQPQMQVEVILASCNIEMPEGKPLVTMRLRYPRIIHGEIMTHRVFSRNARSSRAVPVKTMLNEVRNTPFVPWHWGANQKGMQAGEECNELLSLEGIEEIGREDAWRWLAEYNSDAAEAYMNAGYHKQIPNRLLEPFSWIDTLITSNQWDNFLWLRDHKDAEPHLQDLARLVKQALDEMHVQALEPGEWHLPYITPMDIQNLIMRPDDDTERLINDLGADVNEFLRMISAARCARISYKPFDGDASYERELERYNLLVSSDRVHASPTEHQATPDNWLVDTWGGVDEGWASPELHGNLPGWIQFRKLIPGECHDG